MKQFRTQFTGILLVLSLTIAGQIFAQDRVVMKNGDTLTGDVSLINDSDVIIEPAYTDPIVLDVNEVAYVELDEAVEVELTDESVQDATLTVNDAGEQVMVVDGSERPVSLDQIARAEAPPDYFEWGANVDFNATINDGNTDSRNTLLFAQGNLRLGDHRHLGDLSIQDEEIDGVRTKQQTLLNYSYNWFFNEPWFMGAVAAYERDPVKELDHRYTAGVTIGRDLIDTADVFLTFSFGAGYSDEELGGISDSGAVGLWNLRYEHGFTSWMDFYHYQNFAQQFYGDDNLILKTNTGLRFDLVGDLYANVALRYDYETEPAPGNSEDDTTLTFGLGYSF